MQDESDKQLHEIALIQEALAQSRAGLGIPIEDVVTQFKREGLLPHDFQLDEAVEGDE